MLFIKPAEFYTSLVLSYAKYLPFAKSLDSCQPAGTAQADMNRNCLPMHESHFFKEKYLINTDNSGIEDNDSFFSKSFNES